LEADGGLAFSQGVLLALVDRGLSREDAYGIVQRASAAAWDEGADFRSELDRDPDVQRLLSPEVMNEVFEPGRSLRNLGGVFERLEKVPVEGE
jgi:adenylosuccinate lyase